MSEDRESMDSKKKSKVLLVSGRDVMNEDSYIGYILLIIFVPILFIWAFNVVVLHPFGKHLDTNIWTWIATWVLLVVISSGRSKNDNRRS